MPSQPTSPLDVIKPYLQNAARKTRFLADDQFSDAVQDDWVNAICALIEHKYEQQPREAQQKITGFRILSFEEKKGSIHARPLSFERFVQLLKNARRLSLPPKPNTEEVSHARMIPPQRLPYIPPPPPKTNRIRPPRKRTGSDPP